jgi:thiol-disulfide isomerase/thioredoxin
VSTRTRWLLIVVVLAVAGAVALWPRDSGPQHAVADQPSAAAPAQDLTEARRDAALRPCPAAAPDGPQSLRGVPVTCLGDGRQADLASLVAGRPALVNLWATWCVPCQKELPVLDAYAAQPGAVPVIAVQVQSKEDDGLSLLTSLGVHLPSVVDSSDTIRRALNVSSLPSSYLIGADGSVKQVTDPLVFTSADQVRKVVGG